MITLTEIELERMARHVQYERDMWLWAVRGLTVESGPSAMHNALVEVFLLHSRALTEFFRSKPAGDDVVADQFAPEWQGTKNGDVQILTDALKATNKRWGHLSAYRLQDASVASDTERWSRNVHHLELAWAAFLNALPASRRHWFGSATTL
jgi:hypothetical protein